MKQTKNQTLTRFIAFLALPLLIPAIVIFSLIVAVVLPIKYKIK